MTSTKIIIFALLISNMVFGYLYLSSNGDNRESMGGKREWSILQSLEYDYRQKSIDKIEFKDIDEYHMVCLQSESGQRTWIMLNPKYPPFYKQMPQVQFSLSPDELNRIRNYQSFTSTVEVCLASHLKKK